MKVIFELPDGSTMDDGDPDEDGDDMTPRGEGPGPSEESGDKPKTPSEDLEKIKLALTNAYKGLQPELTEKLKEAEETAKQNAKKLAEAFSKAISSGNYKNAKQFLDGLKKLSDKLPSPKGLFDKIGDV